MTTANKITLTRIAMIPFFIYFAAQPMLIIDETRYLAAFPTSTVIALVPIVIFFLVFQRYFFKGVESGGIKG